MVVANKAVVAREMARRGWSLAQLVGAMDVAENTARSVLSGTEPVGHATQVKLWNAFGGRIPFAKLFAVTAGEEAPVA